MSDDRTAVAGGGDRMAVDRVSPNLLTFRDLAARIERWHERELGNAPLPLRALIIAEEAGEVCRAILKAEQGIRGDPERWTEQAAEEAADVVIAALSMLNALAPVAGPPNEVIAARATVVLARKFATKEATP